MGTEQTQVIRGFTPGMAQLGTSLAMILMAKPLTTKAAIPLQYPMMETLLPSEHALMMAMEQIQGKPEFTTGMARLGANLAAILMAKLRMMKVAFLFHYRTTAPRLPLAPVKTMAMEPTQAMYAFSI